MTREGEKERERERERKEGGRDRERRRWVGRKRLCNFTSVLVELIDGTPHRPHIKTIVILVAND